MLLHSAAKPLVVDAYHINHIAKGERGLSRSSIGGLKYNHDEHLNW
jgi:hypothetical protein